MDEEEKIVANVLRLLKIKPEMYDVLKDIVEYEKKIDSQRKYWKYWEWIEVGVDPKYLRELAKYKLLDVYSTSRRREYRLKDWRAVEKALQLYDVQKLYPETVEEKIPEDLFDIIEGYDDLKELIKMSLQTDEPVHVLFIGPPATAKTLFLLEIARLPRSRYFLASQTTKVGLVEFILEHRPKYVIIDELDKMKPDDYSALLSIAETGKISSAKHNISVDETVKVWFYAAANNENRIPREVLSRFLRVYLKEYDNETYVRVVTRLLVKREKLEPAVAEKIAYETVKYTRDPRDAVRIARLVKGKPEEYIDKIISIMKKYSWRKK